MVLPPGRCEVGILGVEPEDASGEGALGAEVVDQLQGQLGLADAGETLDRGGDAYRVGAQQLLEACHLGPAAHELDREGLRDAEEPAWAGRLAPAGARAAQRRGDAVRYGLGAV